MIAEVLTKKSGKIRKFYDVSHRFSLRQTIADIEAPNLRSQIVTSKELKIIFQ